VLPFEKTWTLERKKSPEKLERSLIREYREAMRLQVQYSWIPATSLLLSFFVCGRTPHRLGYLSAEPQTLSWPGALPPYQGQACGQACIRRLSILCNQDSLASSECPPSIQRRKTLTRYDSEPKSRALVTLETALR